MLGYILKPKHNLIEWFLAYFLGHMVAQENYFVAIIVLVVVSFTSGFLESWYERRSNGL